MPFDNPFEVPFDDIHLLMNARARIASPHCWLQGRFRKGDRYCLVGALSAECDSRSVRLPNRTERRLARRLAQAASDGMEILAPMDVLDAEIQADNVQ